MVNCCARRPMRLFGIAVLVLACGGRPGAAAPADGSANAPSGIAQFPSLLSGYPVRPPWKVAGVDYYVGTPTGAALTDPATASMPGVSVDRSAHSITVSGSNVTLSGYDFGLSGGWQVNVTGGANNVTIQNSRFQVGLNNLMPIQAYYGGTINVLNNAFDGGASSGSSVNAMVFAGGGARVEYNRFTNFPNDGIDITRDGNFTIRFNVFDTMGAGDFHTDAVQTYFSAITSLSIEYNTMYQPPSMSNDGINAFVRIGDQKGNVVHDPVAAHNTIIMASTHATTANVFQWQGQDGAGTLVNPVIYDNFVDPTGVQYSITAPMLHDPTGVLNPVTYDNVDLTTGKRLLFGPWNSRSSGIPAKPPAAPKIAGGRVTDLRAVELTGTAAAGVTVNVFDQGKPLGAVGAGRDGTWSYMTKQLAAGDHAFAARTTDPLSNSSALSEIRCLTIVVSEPDFSDRRGGPSLAPSPGAVGRVSASGNGSPTGTRCAGDPD